ncbi:MAG: branched-chain amino acid ABC transporter permease [Pseudomonadota bacterium]
MTDTAAAAPTRPALSPSLLFGLLIFALLAIVPALTDVWGGSYLLSLVTKAMVLAVVAISLDILIGQAGMVSFGHAAFYALGAYVTGISLEEGLYDAPTILALVVLACTVFAVVTGAISLRTSGVYFIMITLAFGQMVFFTLQSLSAYGGDDGLTLWSLSEVFGARFLADDVPFYYITLGALLLTWWFVARLSASRFGRILRGAKDNATRVEAMGFSVFRYRLIAYVIAAVIAGIGGFLVAHRTEFVSPALAQWQMSGDLIIIVVLGGLGTRNGALIGALSFVLIEEALSEVTQYWRLIFGPLLVLLVLFARGGIAGALGRLGK